MSILSMQGVHFDPIMSRETFCFTAGLYLDGQYLGEVHNDGGGGAHCMSVMPQERARLEKLCKPYAYESYCRLAEAMEEEPRPYDDFGGSLEWVIDDLMGNWMVISCAEQLRDRLAAEHNIAPSDVHVFVNGPEIVALHDKNDYDTFVEAYPQAMRVPSELSINLKEV